MNWLREHVLHAVRREKQPDMNGLLVEPLRDDEPRTRAATSAVLVGVAAASGIAAMLMLGCCGIGSTHFQSAAPNSPPQLPAAQSALVYLIISRKREHDAEDNLSLFNCV